MQSFCVLHFELEAHTRELVHVQQHVSSEGACAGTFHIWQFFGTVPPKRAGSRTSHLTEKRKVSRNDYVSLCFLIMAYDLMLHVDRSIAKGAMCWSRKMLRAAARHRVAAKLKTY